MGLDRNSVDGRDIEPKSVDTDELNNIQFVAPGESISNALASDTRVVLRPGFHQPGSPISATGIDHFVIEFLPGARIATDDGSEEGADAGIAGAVFDLGNGVRENVENFRIVNPQINNAQGGIKIDGAAWFAIEEPDISVSGGTAIAVDRANSFRISHGGELLGDGSLGSRGVHLGTISDPGDNTTAVNDWFVNVDRIRNFEAGVKTGIGDTRWAFLGTIQSNIASCTRGVDILNGQGIHVHRAWLENNTTGIAVNTEAASSFVPGPVTVDKCRFAGNTNDLVVDSTVNGPVVVEDTNKPNPSASFNGNLTGYARLPETPAAFAGSNSGVYLVGGAGTEDLGVSPTSAPANANWPEGSTVRNSNADNDETWELIEGTWVQTV